tara:strand:- start:473 stop:967 length:495 start_codon:yes stop_codon:yes gene_type:complete
MYGNKIIYIVLILLITVNINGCGQKGPSIDVDSVWFFDSSRGIEQCEELKENIGLREHYNFCVEQVASWNKDPTICSRTIQEYALDPDRDDYKERCIFTVVDVNYDPLDEINPSWISYCDEMKDPYRKDNCYSGYGGIVAGACQKISEEYIKDRCFAFEREAWY